MISLQKNASVSLTKMEENLKNITVGLGWDENMNSSYKSNMPFDLDASAFLLKENNKVRSDYDFIFYNQLQSQDGSVIHTGDNRTGDGDGDDESIKINLNEIPRDIHKIVFVVSIHNANERRQSFSHVSNAYIRIVNDNTGLELARFDLSEDGENETAMIFGELQRNMNNEWIFKAISQGINGGLYAIATQYGVNVG